MLFASFFLSLCRFVYHSKLGLLGWTAVYSAISWFLLLWLLSDHFDRLEKDLARRAHSCAKYNWSGSTNGKINVTDSTCLKCMCSLCIKTCRFVMFPRRGFNRVKLSCDIMECGFSDVHTCASVSFISQITITCPCKAHNMTRVRSIVVKLIFTHITVNLAQNFWTLCLGNPLCARMIICYNLPNQCEWCACLSCVTSHVCIWSWYCRFSKQLGRE